MFLKLASLFIVYKQWVSQMTRKFQEHGKRVANSSVREELSTMTVHELTILKYLSCQWLAAKIFWVNEKKNDKTG